MNNNQSESDESKQAESLAVLSGKGGSGKTVMALSMARVLAEAGVKVLLIDCDLATHGATYFLEPEFSGPFLSVLSLSDMLLQKELSGVSPLKAKAGFAFIPSTLDPAEKHEYTSDVEQVMKLPWSSLVRVYGAIILDCQAGYSDTTNWAAKVADRKLIVLEPDSISSAALRVLSMQLGHSLRSSNTWQVFNKLTEEERPIYERVAGGTLFNNLPPLPFDWQVRAAFALGEIPSVLSTSSAFGLGILRLMQRLFPGFKEQLEDLERKSVGDWYTTLNEKLQVLHDMREGIKFRNFELERRRRVRMTTFLSYVGGAAGAVTISYSISARFFETPPGFEILAPMLGVLLVFASAAYAYQVRNDIRMEREQGLAREELERIQQDIQKFETLISTDPRLREYAIKFSRQ